MEVGGHCLSSHAHLTQKAGVDVVRCGLCDPVVKNIAHMVVVGLMYLCHENGVC